MLDPAKLNKCLNKISEQFGKHVESKGKSVSAIQKMTKQAQKLIKHLQSMPEAAHSRPVIETLELLSSICPIEDPDMYKPCALIIQLIFRSLPNSELHEIWTITQDMNLCCHITESTTLKAYLYIEKICTFIENPSIEDPPWFRRFVKILKCKLDGEVDYQNVLPFALYMNDISPLRSTLAFLVLNSFSQINSRVAITIVSSWLTCDHKNPIIANNCRNILKKAPTDTLNMLSTLSFDVPIIFTILPPEIEGYQTLCMITIHRLKSFIPDKLSEFLCLCDTKAREIIHRETSTKNNKTPSLVLPSLTIPKKLQLYDTSKTASRSRSAISEMMEDEITINYLAPVVLFARRSPYEVANFLPQQTAKNIVQALKAPYNTKLTKIPCSQYHPDDVKNLSELIVNCDIHQILQMCGDSFVWK